jgi:hypothetical protein
MREKIARALLMHDMPHVDSWDIVDEPYRQLYLRRADIALDTIIAPTDEMLAAGERVMESSAQHVFYTMICAAKWAGS